MSLHVRGGSYNWSPRYWEMPDVRRDAMQAQSIDRALLSISGSLLGYFLPADDALGAAREINDELAETCRAHGDFLGLGTLPLQDTDLALRELERVANELGLFGVVVGANVNGELWDSPRLFPVLEAAMQMRLFVLVHPDPWMYDRSLSRYHVTEVAAHQAQMTYAAASLIFGGVLDRLPKLQICLGQSGGYLAFLAARLDHAYTTWPAAQVAAALPSEYFSRLYFDSLTYGFASLRHLIEVVGIDRVLLGTDVPSSVYAPNPVAWMRSTPLSSDDQDAILGRNFEQILRAAPTAGRGELHA